MDGQGPTVTTPRISARHAIVAATIGNGLEWYNFTLYGFFAAIIGRQFFPTGNALSSLLLSLATFGVGFFVRPVGGVLLGIYSDKAGRKAALSLTIMAMCAGTAVIACTPGYQTIGLAAPILIVLARMLQGLSAGGEMGNATAFMKEYASIGHRAYDLSWVYASSGIFIAFGIGVASVASWVFGAAALDAWGWRVPFLLGLVIGPVGWYIRNRLPDPPLAQRTNDAAGSPLRDVLARYPRQTLATGALIVLSTVCTYVIHVYTPVYAVRTLKLAASSGFLATTVGNLVTAFLTPVGGWLADRYGVRTVMRTAAILILLSAYPLFALLNQAPNLGSLMLYQIVLGVLAAGYHGPILAAIDDLFPGRSLATGLALADNIAVAVFGGSAAFTITALIAWTGSGLVPAFYLMAAAAIGLAGTLTRPGRLGDGWPDGSAEPAARRGKHPQ
jgi:MHS family proline/betaine transporter-like MFS transporter